LSWLLVNDFTCAEFKLSSTVLAMSRT